MRMRLVALCLLVAGCTAAPDPEAADDGGASMAASATPAPPATDVPRAPPEPGPAEDGMNWSRPHVHDLWGTQRSLVLMNDPVEVMVSHNHAFDQPPRDLHTHGCEQELVSRSQGGSVVFTLPPGSTVIPGAARLDVELDWTAPTITGVMLQYRSPDTSELRGGGLAQAARGEVLSIPLTRPMADQGHEVRSRWDFLLCAWSERGQADLAQGQVMVTMTLRRVEGPLPVDPGHPDHWGDATAVALGTASWEGQVLVAGQRGLDDWREVPLQGMLPWDAEAVRFACDGEVQGTTGPVVVEAWYSPPDREGEWAFQQVALGDSAPQRLEAVLPITSDQTDGVYADATHWMAWFRLRGPVDQPMPGGLGRWTAPERVAADLACTFEALRDPAAEESGAAGEDPAEAFGLASAYGLAAGYVWRLESDPAAGDNPALQARAGQPLRFAVRHGCDLADREPHSLEVLSGDRVLASSADVRACGEETTVDWTPDAPGAYTYRCPHHPGTQHGEVRVAAE